MRAARVCVAVVVLTTARIAWGAGFDCAKASTAIEKKICADGQLSALDGRLAEAYKRALDAAPDRDRLKSEQRAWLTTERNRCADVACLEEAYERRLTVLAGPAADAAPPPAQSPILDKGKGAQAAAAYPAARSRFCNGAAAAVGLDCGPKPSATALASGSFSRAGADQVLLAVSSGLSVGEGETTLVIMEKTASGYRLQEPMTGGDTFAVHARIVTPGRPDLLFLCNQSGRQGLYPTVCGFLGQGYFQARPRHEGINVSAPLIDLQLGAAANCGPAASSRVGQVARDGDRFTVQVIAETYRLEKSAGDQNDRCSKRVNATRKIFDIAYRLGPRGAERLTPFPKYLQALADQYDFAN